MFQPESESSAMERKCLEAVDLLFKRHDWILLARDACIEQAGAYLRDGIAADPYRAVVHAYSHALYAACSGSEGDQRRERGYTELFRYLYAIARQRYPDVAEDATQHALERLYCGFEMCRQPGAFLAFALQHLRNAVRSIRRQNDQPLQSLDASLGPGQPGLRDLLPDGGQFDAAEAVITHEQQCRLAQLAEDFGRRHPRAGQQFAALWLKYIEGLDETAISLRLGKPIRSVYVLRARAIEKLRAEPGWYALALAFGIVPEE